MTNPDPGGDVEPTSTLLAAIGDVALPDVLRLLFFVVFGTGMAFMLATNYLAFHVLRVPQRSGFLWWHVTMVSVAFACLGVLSLTRTLDALGTGGVDVTWRTPVAAAGYLAFLISQVTIFNIERTRYARHVALLEGRGEPQ